MKAAMSYTDVSGVTTCLSFSADHAALAQHFGGSECESSASDLVESFETHLKEIPQVLLQAHYSLLLSLSSASCEILKGGMEDSIIQNNASEEQ